MRRGATGAILLLSLLVSGCTESGALGTNINDPSKVPADAPHVIGHGDSQLTLRVALGGSGGNGSANTPVLVYHVADPINAPSSVELRKKNATFVGRTDERGEILVKVVKGDYYSFFAHNPNYTSEGMHRVRMTADLLKSTQTLTLFMTAVDVTITGTIPLTPVVGIPLYQKGVAGHYPIFFPRELHFDSNPAMDRAYHRRVSKLEVTLTWDSPVPGQPEVVPRIAFTDSYAMDGYQRDTAESSSAFYPPISAGAYRYGMDLPKPKPMMGPLLMATQPLPTDMPYLLRAHAEFSSDPVETQRYYQPNYDLLPGFETGAILVALVGAALLFRRR